VSGLAEVARYQNKVEADLARLLLEAEGLTAIPFDEGMNYVGLGPAMPIRLMVPEAELAEATRLLTDEGMLR
jgi:hypothetical protein